MTNETWIALSASDVLPANSGERKTIVGIKKQDDLSPICVQVTEQVRQAYAMSSRELGPEGTIPSGLQARAIAIALWRFVSEGLPKIEKLQTRERGDAAKEAREYLAQIASTSIGQATSPSVGGKHHKFSHRDQDGV